MNIGIIGAGNIARKMALTVNSMDSDYTMYAVASRTLEKAQDFAKENNVQIAYGSYDELYNDENIDLIYVATPHSHHFEVAKNALEHNKNVLCEKPITINTKQFDILTDIAKERGLFVSEAMWTRFLPIMDKAKEIIKSEEYGKISFVDSNFLIQGMGSARLTKPELAGGALLDLGVYPITSIFMMLGDDYDEVSSYVVKTDLGVDGFNLVNLKYKNNTHANFKSSINCNGSNNTTVHFENGYMLLNNITCPTKILIYRRDDVLLEEFSFDVITGFEYEVMAAKSAIDNNQKECAKYTHKEIRKVLSLMDDLRESWDFKYPNE